MFKMDGQSLERECFDDYPAVRVTFFTVAVEIFLRLSANFQCQEADRYMNL